MHFTAETTSDGVLEREFVVGEVPGVLWSSASRTGHAPLVLLGHGGGRDRKAAPNRGRARLLVEGGFSVAALDAPGHGERPRSAADQAEVDALQRAMAAGEPVGPIVTRYNADIARRAVPEWRAALDVLGADGPVGYYGINMGTAIGIPLVAAEPRITAAVLGQFWYEGLAETARQVTVPLEFTLQWDDEHIPRESGLALFGAFASTEKTLHANAGRHKELPRFEADSAVRFFARHLR